ncbi:MAG: DUF1800 domain-containing protein [Burkholderiales bacterium]|nr:DUF1800 domain-containing protein [Burkholderiales bacterium]
MAWTRDDAAHLLRRAGFGGSLSAVDRLTALGREAAIESLIEYSRVDDPVWSNDNPLGFANPEDDWEVVRATLLYRLYTTRRPLEARLLWFWHGHFTTPQSAADHPLFMRQMQTWRRFATGRFGDFLVAVHKDGGMLRYLNGAGSHRDHPNENFAREVMELYSTGVGPYTEQDVREAARALTGWDVTWPEQEVVFDPDRHDAGTKTVLGRSGNFDGAAVMGILAARPETARRTCAKLYRAFVSDRLNLIELDRLIRAWNSSGGDLKVVMRTLFGLASFWDPRVRATIVKSTLDFGLGLAQRLAVVLDIDRTREALWNFQNMGQAPFNPPNPAGYRTGLRLAGASMLLERAQWASKVVNDWAPDSGIDALSAGLPSPASPDALITTVAARLGVPSLAPSSRAAIAGYLGTTGIARDRLRRATRDVAYLVAVSPEYQVM